MNFDKEPVFITDGGVALALGEPQMCIEFEDPLLPGMRQKAFDEIAKGTFQLNGMKRYWAGCGGGKCVIAGWGG